MRRDNTYRLLRSEILTRASVRSLREKGGVLSTNPIDATGLRYADVLKLTTEEEFKEVARDLCTQMREEFGDKAK